LKEINNDMRRRWFKETLGKGWEMNDIIFLDQLYCREHANLHHSVVSNMSLFHKGIYINVLTRMNIINNQYIRKKWRSLGRKTREYTGSDMQVKIFSKNAVSNRI
jgi:hypothetical protein